MGELLQMSLLLSYSALKPFTLEYPWDLLRFRVIEDSQIFLILDDMFPKQKWFNVYFLLITISFSMPMAMNLISLYYVNVI